MFPWFVSYQWAEVWGDFGVHVYRPVSGWVEERHPKVFSGVTGELLQESVQPRRNVQGTRLVLPVLKLVICNV